jgi:hypothetical protein
MGGAVAGQHESRGQPVGGEQGVGEKGGKVEEWQEEDEARQSSRPIVE